MGQLSNVMSFVAGYVAGSETARRSIDAARSALGEARDRADILRDRALELRDRVDGIRRDASVAVTRRTDAVRSGAIGAADRLGAVRAGATEALDLASAAVDRAEVALRRLSRATARARAVLRRPRGAASPARRAHPTSAVQHAARVVGDVMHPVDATVDVDDAIRVAAVAIGDREDGWAIAVDGERVVGALGTRHLLRAVADGRDPLSTGIGDVMFETTITIPPRASIADAEVLVRYLNLEILIVVEDGRPVGLVRADDVRVPGG